MLHAFIGSGTTWVEFDPDYIVGLTRTHYAMATDLFVLGSTTSAEYMLRIANYDGMPDGEQVKLYDADGEIIIGTTTPMASLWVDAKDVQDDNTTIYTLNDGMTKLNFNYSAEPIIGDSEDGYVLLEDIVHDICSQAGLQADAQSTDALYCGDLEVSWYDNTIQARQYIGWIAELNGGYAIMNRWGKLEFRRYAMSTQNTIDVANCSSFKSGIQHNITQVVFDNSVDKYVTTGGADDESVILDPGNQFIVDGTLYNEGAETAVTIQNIVDNISTYTVGLAFSSINIERMPMDDTTYHTQVSTIEAGDLVEFDLDGVSYFAFMNLEQEYKNGGWAISLSAMYGSPEQATTQINGVNTQIKSIKTIIDRSEASLQILAQSVSNNASNISDLTISVEGVSSTVTQNKEETDGSIAELTSRVEQLPNQITATFSEAIENALDDNEQIEIIETYITADSNGITVGKSDADIHGTFANDGLYFENSGGTVVTWVDGSNQVMGANELQIGDAGNSGNRWRIFATADGNHLRFTRHS